MSASKGPKWDSHSVKAHLWESLLGESKSMPNRDNLSFLLCISDCNYLITISGASSQKEVSGEQQCFRWESKLFTSFGDKRKKNWQSRAGEDLVLLHP